MTWRPVIEKDFGQERFLSKNPDEVFSDPKISPKAVMIGITEDEMTYMVPSMMQNHVKSKDPFKY